MQVGGWQENDANPFQSQHKFDDVGLVADTGDRFCGEDNGHTQQDQYEGAHNPFSKIISESKKQQRKSCNCYASRHDLAESLEYAL